MNSPKQAIRSVVIHELKNDTTIPSFSNVGLKLIDLVNQDVDILAIAEVVKLEPGLTSKMLRLSNSVAMGGKSIKSIEDALTRIGMAEVRNMALSLGVIDQVSNLRVKIDWNKFWLHNLLTARVTEILANAYRKTSGKEYLAGLLHDIGKLYLEHHFPNYFESALLCAMEEKVSAFEAENQLFDITHAEVGALLCEKWGLHKEIIRSIRFHHDPNSPFNKDLASPEEERLLAACICTADSLANMCKANIQGANDFQKIELEFLPEWQLLQKFTPRISLDLDLAVEIQKAQDTIDAYGLQSNSAN